jgi:hypothetical protein
MNDGVAVVDIDGEAVVYDHDSGGQIHYLNHSAALVLDLCDGTATAKQMAQVIAGVYEMPADEVEEQVRGVIRDLGKLGLLEPTGKKAAGGPPEGTNGDAAAEEAGEAADENVDQRALVRMEVPRNT